MTTSDYVLAVVTTLNVITVILNIVMLLKFSDKEADIVTAEKKLIMPVAEVKAECSEEDMKKIKEMLKDIRPLEVKRDEPEEEKFTCDHLYNSIVLIDDPINCREKLVFHCEHCCHEEIMPIERGLMTKFFMGGGTT